MRTPSLWIVAGPNGAGKSTLVDQYLRGRLPIINPDDLAAEFGGMLAGGRVALARRVELLATGESFVVETTLAGSSGMTLVAAAIDAGFRLKLIYIGLASAPHAAERVRARVAAGGHHVDTADVVRRFGRSLRNAADLASQADRLLLFDNSGRRRRLVASYRQGRRKFVASAVPNWAKPICTARDDAG